MNGVAQIQLGSFLLVYVLLLVVLGIMKKCRINQTKLLVLASARMTLQLIAAGYALTFLFEHPHPLLTWAIWPCWCFSPSIWCSRATKGSTRALGSLCLCP